MGKIEAVCISKEKGTVKTQVDECEIIEQYGLKNDAHAGSGRQVSLLSYEAVEAFKNGKGKDAVITPGVFGENLLVSGFDLAACKIGTRFLCGDVVLELMQIGKTCHSGCEISKITGECIMPREGVFASVLCGGTVKRGDDISMIEKKGFKASVLTASDRSFAGEREDISGPLIKRTLLAKGYDVMSLTLLPDDEDGLYDSLVKICDREHPDLLITTGGTGFSKRDQMPEATMRAGKKNAPGIAEAIRAYSMQLTPRAMLSRAVSVIRDDTLIVNLPGSPQAVKECLDFLLDNIDHGLMMLRGEADG